MKPSQVAQALRHIASGIEKSQKPQKHLVAKEIKKIVAQIGGGSSRIVNITDEIVSKIKTKLAGGRDLEMTGEVLEEDEEPNKIGDYLLEYMVGEDYQLIVEDDEMPKRSYFESGVNFDPGPVYLVELGEFEDVYFGQKSYDDLMKSFSS